jgi:hypothetical protein
MKVLLDWLVLVLLTSGGLVITGFVLRLFSEVFMFGWGLL